MLKLLLVFASSLLRLSQVSCSISTGLLLRYDRSADHTAHYDNGHTASRRSVGMPHDNIQQFGGQTNTGGNHRHSRGAYGSNSYSSGGSRHHGNVRQSHPGTSYFERNSHNDGNDYYGEYDYMPPAAPFPLPPLLPVPPILPRPFILHPPVPPYVPRFRPFRRRFSSRRNRNNQSSMNRRNRNQNSRNRTPNQGTDTINTNWEIKDEDDLRIPPTKKTLPTTTTTRKPIITTTTTKRPLIRTTTTKRPFIITTTKKPSVELEEFWVLGGDDPEGTPGFITQPVEKEEDEKVTTDSPEELEEFWVLGGGDPEGTPGFITQPVEKEEYDDICVGPEDEMPDECFYYYDDGDENPTKADKENEGKTNSPVNERKTNFLIENGGNIKKGKDGATIRGNLKKDVKAGKSLSA